jgi:Fic family protein
MTVERILELHAIVTKGTLESDDQAGRLRTTDDIRVVERLSGEVIYSPPQAKLLPESLQALCRLANDDGAFGAVHPFVKASVLHFLIGYLHPFSDGNGRTARALFYWHMLRKGYWQAEYLSISRILLKAPLWYGRAYLYSETDGNDLTYFVLHQLGAMEKAMDDLDAYLEQKSRERGQALALLDILGLNERQSEILGWLRKEPGRALGIREVKNVFGVVYQTARTDLLGLEELGLLSRKVIGRKEFVFTRAEGFDEKIMEASRPAGKM